MGRGLLRMLFLDRVLTNVRGDTEMFLSRRQSISVQIHSIPPERTLFGTHHNRLPHLPPLPSCSALHNPRRVIRLTRQRTRLKRPPPALKPLLQRPCRPRLLSVRVACDGAGTRFSAQDRTSAVPQTGGRFARLVGRFVRRYDDDLHRSQVGRDASVGGVRRGDAVVGVCRLCEVELCDDGREDEGLRSSGIA
jgi:hypothetical protein